MPELPEVETIARDLRALVVGRTITGVRTDWPRMVAYPDLADFVAGLHGRRVADVRRRAKWLLLDLDGGGVLAIQVRMTGQLFVVPAERLADRHVHLVIDLDDGRQLRLRDMRKFARIGLYRRDALGRVVSERRGPDGIAGSVDLFARHGPEPLAPDFSLAQFRERLHARRGRLKSLLLDQSFVAGVGNIYADEALWRARLHPVRTVATLRPGDEARLYGALREVLAEAVARRGSSIDDYTAPSGDGEMQGYLRAYQRTGLPCLRCGRPMRRITVGQRGTHFCSWCQRLPAADRTGAAGLLALARGNAGEAVRRGLRWSELPGEGTLGLTPSEAAMAAARARTGTSGVGGNTANEALRAPASAARTRRAAATRRRAARDGAGA